jgi:hypothetical protein
LITHFFLDPQPEGRFMSNRFLAISVMLLIPVFLLQIAVQEAKGAMISTESVLRQATVNDSRARVGGFLERDEVRAAMMAQGVDPVEAKHRVASLSDEEILRVAATIDRLPAGGNGLGAVIGAGVLIFLVLLVTDILGLTHVFSFVNR